MATDAQGGDKSKDFVFAPEHLAVDREIRKLLKRVIKVQRDSLEFIGETFEGFVRFEIPKGDTFNAIDILTVCVEIAQADLGEKATVSSWLIHRANLETVDLTPAEFELQAEDHEQRPPMSTKEFADLVLPSEGR